MNRLLKRTIVRSLFLLEVAVMVGLYLFGRQGLPLVVRLHKKNKTIEREIQELDDAVEALAENLKNWHNYPFYKEKIAREHLQMAREGDRIYYYTEQPKP